jgi:hypothetical protein
LFYFNNEQRKLNSARARLVLASRFSVLQENKSLTFVCPLAAPQIPPLTAFLGARKTAREANGGDTHLRRAARDGAD